VDLARVHRLARYVIPFRYLMLSTVSLHWSFGSALPADTHSRSHKTLRKGRMRTFLVLLAAAAASAAHLRRDANDEKAAMVLGPDAVSHGTRDVTTREGLGENLPYPSVDYLGEYDA